MVEKLENQKTVELATLNDFKAAANAAEVSVSWRWKRWVVFAAILSAAAMLSFALQLFKMFSGYQEVHQVILKDSIVQEDSRKEFDTAKSFDGHMPPPNLGFEDVAGSVDLACILMNYDSTMSDKELEELFQNM